MQLYARLFPVEVTGLAFVDAVPAAADACDAAVVTTAQMAQRNALLVPNAEHLTLDDLRARAEVQAAGPLRAGPRFDAPVHMR